jgi:hypothetical protein
VVLDPDGVLVTGQEQRIPFQLTEADSGVDVILLTEHPQAVDFRLQTPSGLIVQPWRAIAEPRMTWVQSQGLQYYRIVLPTELYTARYDQAGTWQVLVTIGRPQVERPEDGVDLGGVPEPGAPTLPESAPGRRDPIRRLPPLQRQGRGVEGVMQEAPTFAAIEAHGRPRPRLPYSILVHSYSNLSLRASVRQTGFEPGATVHLNATLAESGIPPRPGSSVSAEVSRPDGTSTTVVLTESHPGSFEGTFTTSVSGVYRCRVRASGRTRLGYPYQREQTVTAAVGAAATVTRIPTPRAAGRWSAGSTSSTSASVACSNACSRSAAP